MNLTKKQEVTNRVVSSSVQIREMGRKKHPELEIVDLNELKKQVKEIKKRKKGLYLRYAGKSRDRGSSSH